MSEKSDLILLLDVLGYELQSSNLVGNACPSVQRRWKRMSEPQTGDLVMETSTAYARQRNATNEWAICPFSHIRSEIGLGILLRISDEPYPREEDEEWDDEIDGPWPTEKVWYIQRLDEGTESRWTNANFITLIPSEGWENMSGHRLTLLDRFQNPEQEDQ